MTRAIEETESNSWIEFISWWGDSITGSRTEFFYSDLNSLSFDGRSLPSGSKNDYKLLRRRDLERV